MIIYAKKHMSYIIILCIRGPKGISKYVTINYQTGKTRALPQQVCQFCAPDIFSVHTNVAKTAGQGQHKEVGTLRCRTKNYDFWKVMGALMVFAICCYVR